MIFSVLAFIAVIVSICIKDRKKSLVVQSLNCICEAIYDFIISAFTGAVLSIINFIRTCLFINKDKFSKKIYLLILILFESLYGSYYIYYHSWFMVLGDLILLITGIIAVYKNDIKKIHNNKSYKER